MITPKAIVQHLCHVVGEAEIIRGIYDKTRTIRLPVHFIELKNLFFKVFYELLKELGREPSPQEISERANLPLDKVQMVLTLAAQPISSRPHWRR